MLFNLMAINREQKDAFGETVSEIGRFTVAQTWKTAPLDMRTALLALDGDLDAIEAGIDALRTELYMIAPDLRDMDPYGDPETLFVRTVDSPNEIANFITVKACDKEILGFRTIAYATAWKSSKQNETYTCAYKFALSDDSTVWVRCNRRGVLEPREFGIGSIWDVFKEGIAKHALCEATALREHSKKLTKVTYHLVTLAKGVAKRG